MLRSNPARISETIAVFVLACACSDTTDDQGTANTPAPGDTGGYPFQPSTGGSFGGAGSTGGNSPSTLPAGGNAGSGIGGVSGAAGRGASGSGGVDVGTGGVSTPDASIGTGGASMGTDAGGASGTVRFVAVGDTGKGTPEQTQVAEAIRAKCERDGCDFVQLLGDNIYENGVASVDDPEWQAKFVAPYQSVELPFWVVLGNHDYGGLGRGFEPMRAQAEVDYTAKSSKWKLPSNYYRRTVSNVEFFALDTTPGMFGQHAQQKSEVADWLSQSKAQWKVALGHHPYLSNGEHGNAGSYDGVLGVLTNTTGAGVKELLEATICGKADVYLSGHDHSLQWLEGTCAGTELIVSGTGAAPTSLPGTSPARYQSVKLGFLYAVVSGNTFQGTFIDATGNVEFSRTIAK